MNNKINIRPERIKGIINEVEEKKIFSQYFLVNIYHSLIKFSYVNIECTS